MPLHRRFKRGETNQLASDYKWIVESVVCLQYFIRFLCECVRRLNIFSSLLVCIIWFSLFEYYLLLTS